MRLRTFTVLTSWDQDAVAASSIRQGRVAISSTLVGRKPYALCAKLLMTSLDVQIMI
jgi:hypothetical protein